MDSYLTWLSAEIANLLVSETWHGVRYLNYPPNFYCV